MSSILYVLRNRSCGQKHDKTQLLPGSDQSMPKLPSTAGEQLCLASERK